MKLPGQQVGQTVLPSARASEARLLHLQSSVCPPHWTPREGLCPDAAHESSVRGQARRQPRQSGSGGRYRRVRRRGAGALQPRLRYRRERVESENRRGYAGCYACTQRERENRLPRFYLHYLRAALGGDLGESDALKTPVTELLRERAPLTARLIGWGTAGGLLLGAALAWLAVWPRRIGLTILSVSASGLLLAVPPAVLALAFFFNEAPLGLAVALALMPRVFGTLRALLDNLYTLLAEGPARGLARARSGTGGAGDAIRSWDRRCHALDRAGTGVALVLAFGAIIPIEALCDVPGIGQLAWKAQRWRAIFRCCADSA